MISGRDFIAILLSGVLFSLLRECPAQEPWKVIRLAAPIELDGVPNEEAWKQIKAFPIVTHWPVSGNPVSEETLVRLAYDTRHLYVGARLMVSEPDLIRAIGKKRDMNSMSCDWFGISLDTYNDKENAMLFFTNPLGLRWDATVQNDGTPMDDTEPVNMDWNTHWKVATRMNDQGWYVEMQIPFSSLRFQDEDGKTIMGASFFRWLPARNESYIYPETPLDWGTYSSLKPSMYAELQFEGLTSGKPLYLTPYLLAGYDQSHHLNDPEDAYLLEGHPRIEPGLDVKFRINPNTTLDLTFNTDFAQVEADDQQFNLTRFSLYFPEKRMFFLERSSIFDFDLGAQTNLFYSRKIGLYEGEPVRIWGGARLNSRVSDWDIGLLNLQTASFENLPSENFGVARIKKRIFNLYSYAGGMVTSRLGADGSYNLAYGLDGVIRLFGDEYLTVRWAQTFRDSTVNDPLSLDPARVLVHWERRKQEGLSYMLLGTWSGTGFDPGIGFEIFNDYFATRQDVRYTWISPDSANLQTHYLLLRNYHLNSVVDGSLITYSLGPLWSFTTKNNWFGSIYAAYQVESLREEFDILDRVTVPVGTYRFLQSEWMLMTPGSRSLSAVFTLEGGGYFDGYKISPGVEPSWKIGSSLELGGIYRYDRVRFPSREQSLNNHIAGLRALYMLSTRISFSAFVQYNTSIEKVISNFRFRYNPAEGTDLYVVFNEGRNTHLEREVPALPAFEERNVTVKFNYTFQGAIQ